ncbi:hypothetical protein PPROV_000913000 [Pycnococcus provasolii]|uniref:Uncharacterized protein n=1 Tax=Pycnococcus provasolii TaxID=41880 RepID=A0A830I010_9CHLO|nr:hypothetical protein PPROV_000913000 [Pycnococcus provasolii]
MPLMRDKPCKSWSTLFVQGGGKATSEKGVLLTVVLVLVLVLVLATTPRRTLKDHRSWIPQSLLCPLRDPSNLQAFLEGHSSPEDAMCDQLIIEGDFVIFQRLCR